MQGGPEKRREVDGIEIQVHAGSRFQKKTTKKTATKNKSGMTPHGVKKEIKRARDSMGGGGNTRGWPVSAPGRERK